MARAARCTIAVVRPGAGGDFVFLFREAEKNYGRKRPEHASAGLLLTASSTERLKTPGMERTSLRTPDPLQTNMG